ncbi:hypothetical protein [Pseudorhodobacter sp.]|uniref:phosphorylase family protein n=1 Tax=Pseudorhodobacter sp. TaxID=1934400 RepID=UPI0026494062|nr:hypothetical protein [Pseudorhodobacter sp.]MDN5789008.1 hypothetical protein [Pseudorhodobacter sp.]
MRTAWYLGYSDADVGEAAILVGDPDRVNRIGKLLDTPAFLPEKRGLRSVTGGFNGKRVTVAAFGMGAPIASIVMHELADLGVKRFLRIGTAMHFPPAKAGSFLISKDALAFDGTSPAYVADGTPLLANARLVDAAVAAIKSAGEVPHVGTYATFDAFYRDMFALIPEDQPRVAATRARLHDLNVLATDMETSALLAVGQALKVEAATLCLGTVDGSTQQKLGAEALASGEAQMFRIALNAITAE